MSRGFRRDHHPVRSPAEVFAGRLPSSVRGMLRTHESHRARRLIIVVSVRLFRAERTAFRPAVSLQYWFDKDSMKIEHRVLPTG